MFKKDGVDIVFFGFGVDLLGFGCNVKVIGMFKRFISLSRYVSVVGFLLFGVGFWIFGWVYCSLLMVVSFVEVFFEGFCFDIMEDIF